MLTEILLESTHDERKALEKSYFKSEFFIRYFSIVLKFDLVVNEKLNYNQTLKRN
jgi:hypothetical protein